MILDFLKTYYREIIEIILVITSFVLFVARKRPIKVIDTIKEVILRLLPYCINKAEVCNGDDKKTFALSLLAELLRDLGYDLLPDYEKFAGEQLEIILSTPQKKGMSYVKKNEKK